MITNRTCGTVLRFINIYYVKKKRRAKEGSIHFRNECPLFVSHCEPAHLPRFAGRPGLGWQHHFKGTSSSRSWRSRRLSSRPSSLFLMAAVMPTSHALSATVCFLIRLFCTHFFAFCAFYIHNPL